MTRDDNDETDDDNCAISGDESLSRNELSPGTDVPTKLLE